MLKAASSGGAGRRRDPMLVRAAVVGALGGLVGFLLGEIIYARTSGSPVELVFRVGVWSALIGLGLGPVLLVNDNVQSLRGRWDRDLRRAVPVFAGLGFLSGAVAQGYYQSGVQNSLTRGLGWALLGAGLGLALGALRGDTMRALRGAVGGAAGGFVGGLIFNTVAAVAADDRVSRALGLAITGAAIALLIRVVQEAFKGAWLVGITTGPYEGKEYPLGKARVTLGRSDANDISLYRERNLPLSLGSFVFARGMWAWEGAPVSVNGGPEVAPVVLHNDDSIRFGGTEFLFQARSLRQAAVAQPASPSPLPTVAPTAQTDAVASGPMSASPVAAPVAWSLEGASGRLTLPGGEMCLGRGEGNDLVLADPTVSGSHATLQVTSGGVTVTDLGSTNGTFLNGRRLAPDAPEMARDGDSLRFGAREFRLVR